MPIELAVDVAAQVDVWVHPSLFPAGTQAGDLIAIRPAHVGKGKRKDHPLLYKIPEVEGAAKEGRKQVVVNSHCAGSFHWIASRVEVTLQLVLTPPSPAFVATYVELSFTGVYLSRPDMLRFSISLSSQAIYTGQRITLQGARLSVASICTTGGRPTRSAWVDGETKIVFRSESARTYLFVEVSAEMFQFDEGNMGAETAEIFLGELVRNWQGGANSSRKGHAVNHVVSVILYGRVIYEDDGEGDEERAPVSRNENGMIYRDFYKVLLDSHRSPPVSLARAVSQEMGKWQEQVLLRTRISGEEKRAGRIAFAHESNILEASNLALNLFEEHWIDRDLQRTGLSLIVVSAGTSFYHVSKTLLRTTTERMFCHGIGLDLISLAKPPLHSVPLFSFASAEPTLAQEGSTGRIGEARDPRRLSTQLPEDQRDPLYYDSPLPSAATSIFYAEPEFVFPNFFGNRPDKPSRMDRFMPRARCYELSSQGTGERIQIAIPLLSPVDAEESEWNFLTEAEKRQARRDRYDALAVGAKVEGGDVIWRQQSGATSGTSSSSVENVKRLPIDILHNRKRSDTNNRSASSAASTVERERGRERAASEANRIPSSTRSRTPVGRVPRPASITSVKTVSSKIDSRSTASKSTVPSLISRLTAQATTIPTPVAPPRSSWLGLFRGAIPSVKTPTASTGVQRVEAQANSKPQLSLETLSDTTSRPSSISSPSPVDSSRRSSITTTAPRPPPPNQPTQPISISSRPPMTTREADRPDSVAPSSLVLRNFAPVEEVPREERSMGKRRFDKFNPSKANVRSVGLVEQERRWASLYERSSNKREAVDWVAMCIPACLPIVSDYLPSPKALANFYAETRYSIPTTSTTNSMLLRPTHPTQSSARELMLEMVSQRLSHGFQIVVSENDKTIEQVLEEVHAGEDTAIYLSLSNQIHCLSYERRTQSVIVKISRKHRSWQHTNYQYSALIWTEGSLSHDQVNFTFPLPNLIEVADWEYLDRLVAGVEEADLRPSLRYWRTRLVLLPSDGVPERDFLLSESKSLDAKSLDEEINLEGFRVLMEMLQAARWKGGDSEKDAVVTTEITHLTPADWALKVAHEASLAAGSAQSGPTTRPPRWLRRPHATAKEELLSIDRERTISPERRRPLSPTRTRTLSPPRDAKRPVVEMTSCLILDLDPSNKSDRSEKIVCHLDRSHNPQAAYHIELAWLGASGKVIDLWLKTLNRQAQRYGLRLVELSSRPIVVVDRHNPFQKSTVIPLALAPPDGEIYLAHLLRSIGYFLDIGCDETFPESLDVKYSYRTRTSKYSQYVHRSGSGLVAIVGQQLAFAPNRIYLSHDNFNSRLDPQELLVELITLCDDGERLRRLYENVQESLIEDPNL